MRGCCQNGGTENKHPNIRQFYSYYTSTIPNFGNRTNSVKGHHSVSSHITTDPCANSVATSNM